MSRVASEGGSLMIKTGCFVLLGDMAHDSNEELLACIYYVL